MRSSRLLKQPRAVGTVGFHQQGGCHSRHRAGLSGRVAHYVQCHGGFVEYHSIGYVGGCGRLQEHARTY